MSTDHHTAISTGAAANAATFNSPLGELDAAIGGVTNGLKYQTVQDNGSDKTQRGKLDFIGLSVADDSGGNRTKVTAAYEGAKVDLVTDGSYLVTDSVEGAIDWSAIAQWNVGGIFNHSGEPTQLVCKVAGKYLIVGTIVWDDDSDIGVRIASIKKNGSTVIAKDLRTADGAHSSTNQVMCIVSLAVNDYVELLAFQDSGGDIGVMVDLTTFTMQRIAL